MRKTISIILALFIILCPMSLISVSADTYVPSRIINLVYDDSGSMIRTDSQYVDTWCQAKYAMEVFAAMLGEKDTLNIFYMSDYVSGNSAPPKISLHGSRDSATTTANVAQIHNMVTDASDTPFSSVVKAYGDLSAAQADEKWLVVLTDGEFNSTSNSKVENYFHQCVSDGQTKTVMFSMGPNAASINPDEAKNIFFYKAANNAEIPLKLTGVCNRIFQNNALPFDKDKNSAAFNIPMSELIVFAQGKNVSIGNIDSSDGESIKPDSNVKVMYSTEATTDKHYSKDKICVSDNLIGYVATYSTDFKPGTYKFDIKGADTVEVYYKPNVTIAAYLYNDDNEEVTQEKRIVSGKYRLEFGFLSGIDGKKITDTSLLKNITYQSKINNIAADGTSNQIDAKSGDIISIKQGKLDIDVIAKFLEYNTVNTKLSYNVFAHSDLLFNFTEKPTYELTTKGFTNTDKPMVLKVQIDDGSGPQELTPAQWKLLGTPTVTSDSGVGEFRVEHSDEIGTYYIYPTLKNDDPYAVNSGPSAISVSGQFVEGDSSAQGKLNDTFRIDNKISKMDRLKNWLKKNGLKLAISILILLLVLGYIPPFKKYLPRKLKKRPLIECTAEKIGQKDREAHGKYQKNILSTVIPYKSETGFVTFSPSPYKKTAQLRAAGSNGMYVTNTKMFAGKENITFNGMSIEEKRIKPYRISSASTIALRSPEYTYTCYLNK